MSDELKPGETRVYDKHGRLVATNRGLVGQGGGGGPSYFPTIIRPEPEENSEQETEIARHVKVQEKKMETLINAIVFAGLVAIFGFIIQLLHVMIENPVAGLLVVVCAVTATVYLTFR